MTTTKEGFRIRFETKSCGRCGGSGRYSYCSMYGSVCFGCGGTGTVLSRKGSDARAAFEATMIERLGVRVDGLHVGDKIWHIGDDDPLRNAYSRPRWRKVEAIDLDGGIAGTRQLTLRRVRTRYAYPPEHVVPVYDEKILRALMQDVAAGSKGGATFEEYDLDPVTRKPILEK